MEATPFSWITFTSTTLGTDRCVRKSRFKTCSHMWTERYIIIAYTCTNRCLRTMPPLSTASTSSVFRMALVGDMKGKMAVLKLLLGVVILAKTNFFEV